MLSGLSNGVHKRDLLRKATSQAVEVETPKWGDQVKIIFKM